MTHRSGKLILALALCLCLVVGGCALPAGSGGEARILAEARQNYRNASLVVSGVCKQSHVNANGDSCYDLSIDRVLAGDASSGDVIHCTSPMTEGESYLLYLQAGEDVAHTEDMLGYTLVSGEPLALSKGKVVYDGQAVDLDALLADMALLDAMISAPSASFYYDDLAALAQAADDIFIGRVDRVPPLQDTQFRSQNNGAIVEHTIPAAVAQVTAFGGIKGALKYGDQLQLVYAPAMNADVVNAATLAAEPYTTAQAPKLEPGGIYLFFLLKGPDAKQSYAFLVNPMQGFVQVEGDELAAPAGNRAFQNVRSLDAAVTAIRLALNGTAS